MGFEPPTSGLATHCANHYATWEPTHTIHTHSHTYARTSTGIIRMTHALTANPGLPGDPGGPLLPPSPGPPISPFCPGIPSDP